MSNIFESIIRDVVVGIRGLSRYRAVSIAAILCLAVGFGAATAIFSVVDGVLLRPLPYPDAGEIVQLNVRNDVAEFSATPRRYDFWSRHANSFESIATLNGMASGYNLTGGETPVRVTGYHVTADYFGVFGVAPALGRTFSPGEDKPGAEAVVVLSDGVWRRRFAADSTVVGRTVLLSGQPYTVVGVMPESFRSYPDAAVWLPLDYESVINSESFNYQVVARLKAGTSIELAQADMDRVFADYQREYGEGEEMARSGIAVGSFQENVVGNTRRPLLVLIGAVGLLLLIACVNVAHLLLARATDRRREIAVRVALGASRRRLLRQLMTESLLLSLIGGIVGYLVALWGVDGLLAMMPADLPRAAEIVIDTRVLAVTLGVSMLTGLGFGLAPALHGIRVDVHDALKDATGRGTESSAAGRLRRMLMSSEVALTLVLLIGAGLLTQTFMRLASVDPGFQYDGVLTAQLSLIGERYDSTEEVAAFQDRLLTQLRAVPGVEYAAATSNLPLEQPLNLPVGMPENPDMMRAVEFRLVSPEYFAALTISLRAGRVINHEDIATAAPVALVNEAFARQFMEGDEAVGRIVQVGYIKDAPRTVVGVMADIREFGVASAAAATVYVPAAQAPDQITNLVNSFLPTHLLVRCTGDPANLIAAVRREVQAVDPDLPVASPRLMAEVFAGSLAQQRFRMQLLVLFGAVALVLSGVGLYGVMASSVARRTREIGVRMALGANASHVRWMIVKQAGVMCGVGIIVGLVAALGLTTLLRDYLYDINASDPATYAGLALLMFVVALAASYLPARRATSVRPMVALRQE